MTNPTGSILVRRGPTTDRNGFYPLVGEIIYDTTTNRFHIGDGVTAGGVSINQRDFPNPGVMIKGTSADTYLVAPGNAEGTEYQFLVYSKDNGQYEFSSITSSGVAITNLKLTGASGITVTRTDTDPDQTNPTVTTTAQVTFDVNASTLRTTLSVNNVTNESKATMFTSPTFTGTTTMSTLSVGSSTGVNGQVLSSTGSGLQWLTLSASSISNGTSNVSVASNSDVTITIGSSLVGTFSSAGLSLTTPLALAQGGTGANGQTAALTNLVPTGEVSGYVLTTSGRGGYYWAAASGGGGAVGTAINTSRVTFTATANQTVFTGVGTYTAGAGQLRVYIDGVRQFPSEYSETSSTSFTLNTGVPAGTNVLAEVDGYTSTTITAASVTNSPAGNISSVTVQAALNELDSEKASLATPTFTTSIDGSTTFTAFSSSTALTVGSSSGTTTIPGKFSMSGVSVIAPNYIPVATTTSYSLSTSTSTNVLLVSTAGLTATLNMPTTPIDGQVCAFAVHTNTVTLAVGTGTVAPTFAGSATAGTVFKYVYRTTGTTWYRII